MNTILEVSPGKNGSQEKERKEKTNWSKFVHTVPAIRIGRVIEKELSFLEAVTSEEVVNDRIVNIIFYEDNPDGRSYLASIKKVLKGHKIVFKEYEYGENIENKEAPYLIIGGSLLDHDEYASTYGLRNKRTHNVDPSHLPSIAVSVAYALLELNCRINEKNEKESNGKRLSDVVIIGRSDNAFVTAKLLEQKYDCTVTLVHTKTKDISKYMKEADCIVSFAGSPGLIKSKMVKENAAIIPVGMKKDEDGTWLDDIDRGSFEKDEKGVYIADGIGRMTAFFTALQILWYYAF